MKIQRKYNGNIMEIQMEIQMGIQRETQGKYRWDVKGIQTQYKGKCKGNT